MDWQEQLISVYLMVCKEYVNSLCGYISRLSNYSNMSFSDEEVMTVYIFGIMSGYKEIKNIYDYTCRHLYNWFPSLPTYTGFIQRLNKLSSAFKRLAKIDPERHLKEEYHALGASLSKNKQWLAYLKQYDEKRAQLIEQMEREHQRQQQMSLDRGGFSL